jgi:hypothetical protein
MARQDAALAHSAAEPRGGRTRCGPYLGRAAIDRQPLDGRGDGVKLLDAMPSLLSVTAGAARRPPLMQRPELTLVPAAFVSARCELFAARLDGVLDSRSVRAGRSAITSAMVPIFPTGNWPPVGPVSRGNR